jgi:hypothetical protein
MRSRHGRTIVGVTTFRISASLVKWAPSAWRAGAPMLLWKSAPKIGGSTFDQSSAAACARSAASPGVSSTGSAPESRPPPGHGRASNMPRTHRSTNRCARPRSTPRLTSASNRAATRRVASRMTASRSSGTRVGTPGR